MDTATINRRAFLASAAGTAIAAGAGAFSSIPKKGRRHKRRPLAKGRYFSPDRPILGKDGRAGKTLPLP